MTPDRHLHVPRPRDETDPADITPTWPQQSPVAAAKGILLAVALSSLIVLLLWCCYQIAVRR